MTQQHNTASQRQRHPDLYAWRQQAKGNNQQTSSVLVEEARDRQLKLANTLSRELHEKLFHVSEVCNAKI